MGKWSKPNTEPFLLRILRLSQMTPQTCLLGGLKARPWKSGPCLGPHCALLSQWPCLQAIMALTNRAGAQGEQRSYFSSKVSCANNTLLNNYYVPDVYTDR